MRAPIPDLSIKAIRFVADSYKNCDMAFIYQELGNYLRTELSNLNENTTFEDVLSLVFQLDEEKILQFFNKCSTKYEYEKFKQIFQSRLLCFICKELQIPIPETK